MGRMSKTDTTAETSGMESKTKTPEKAAVSAPRADSLYLWNRLKRTDPKATKPFARPGGFRGTQIDPTWRLQMMTEVFGPVGKGWGYEQMDWTIAERMVFICAHVWYIDPQTGQTCWTGPQWGGTEMLRRRNGIEAPDDECFKMSMTDAVGKCLLQLGLGADIYMGQFDDSKYREESEAYYAIKANPALQPEAIQAFESEVKGRLDACLDLDDLEEVWRAGVSVHLREIGTVDKAAQHRITALFAQKKGEIIKREEADGREAA